MTKQSKKLLEQLIEQMTIEAVEPCLDDDMPDLMADAEPECIQELVDYIDKTYDIQTSGMIDKKMVLEYCNKMTAILERKI